MKVEVSENEVKWRADKEKETHCEFYRGECKATTQTSCLKCRFINPCSQYARKIYEDKLIKLKADNTELDHLTKSLTKTVGELEEKNTKLESEIESLKGLKDKEIVKNE